MSLKPLTLLRPASQLRLGILSFQERINLGADRPIPVHCWEFPHLNADAIKTDFDLITAGRYSAHIPEHVRTTNPDNIFLEPGGRLEHCILNAQDGPIYIGKNALVMDGAILRGPVAIGDHAIVKMGALLFGGTSIGPYGIVGGEVKNSILMDYSNKAHDGYLGDSVVGAWCNLGAGTTCSNLRNTGSAVKLWDMDQNTYATAGNKQGLVMGDFTRTAICTAINTGTIIGACAHVFGHTGLTPRFIPSFAWGAGEHTRADLEKLITQISTWMSFKGKTLTPEWEDKIRKLYLQLQ